MFKVFMCERTPQHTSFNNFMCLDCKHRMRIELPEKITEEEFEAVSWNSIKPPPCEVCQGVTELTSRGCKPIFRRLDTGEEIFNLRDHPGACYADKDGAWDSTSRTHKFGPDGRALVLILPDGFSWYIDSRASNCDMKTDNDHRCWVRHGSPELPETFHVDKNGLTCGAGAGSIDSKSWYGFCHNGELKVCP